MSKLITLLCFLTAISSVKSQTFPVCNDAVYYFTSDSIGVISEINSGFPVNQLVCPIKKKPTAGGFSHNGLSFNVQDSCLYYLSETDAYGGHLFKMDANCDTTEVLKMDYGVNGCIDLCNRFIYYEDPYIRTLNLSTLEEDSILTTAGIARGYDIDFNPKNCIYYILTGSTVVQIDSTGNTLSTFITNGLSGSLAVGESGNFFYLANNDSIRKYDAFTGALSQTSHLSVPAKAFAGSDGTGSRCLPSIDISLGTNDTIRGTSCNDSLVVNFTHSEEGPINDFVWDFGNGITSPVDTSYKFVVPGIYSVTLSAQANCVSCKNNELLNDTVIVVLTSETILTSLTIAQTFCYKDSVEFPNGSGSYFLTSGTKAVNKPNILGCDSVLIYDVTILPLDTSSITIGLCAGSPFTSPLGNVFTTDTVITETIASIETNCDSTTTFTLLFDVARATISDQYLCQGSGDSLFVGDNWYKTSGVIEDTLTLAASGGCDSIVTGTIILVPIPAIGLADTIYSCPGTSKIINAVSYTKDTTITLASQTLFAGCDSSYLQPIKFTDPVPSFLDTTICQGQSILFNGVNRTTTGDYLQTFSNAAFGGCDSLHTLRLTVLPTITLTIDTTICDQSVYTSPDNISYTQANTYSYGVPSQNAAVLSANCDSISGDINLIVNPSYTGLSALSIDSLICDGDSAFIQGVWGKTTQDFTFNLTTSQSCDSNVTIHLIVLDLPATTISNDSITCEEDSLVLSGSAPGILTLRDTVNYSWNPTGSTNSTLTVSPPVGTSVTYELIISHGGCSDSASRTVTSYSKPTVFAGANQEITQQDTISLIATGGSATDTYQWIPSTLISCPTCDSTYAQADLLGGEIEYCVILSTDKGCYDTSCLLVTINLDCFNIYIPNAFTPNNDGVNDVFQVYGNCIETMNLMIFDRWGAKVFESNNQSQSWDGTYNDQLVNHAVFVYFLKGILITGEEFELKGNVSLMK